jgi:hypothetical protein
MRLRIVDEIVGTERNYLLTLRLVALVRHIERTTNDYCLDLSALCTNSICKMAQRCRESGKFTPSEIYDIFSTFEQLYGSDHIQTSSI